jgi:hypothetical protein
MDLWQRHSTAALRAADLIEAQAREIEWLRDFGGDAVEVAGRILENLWIGQDASKEPGADRRRDRVAAMVQRALENGPAVLADAPSEIATLKKERDEAREALRECQSALAMMINPDRISGTTIMAAVATATAAEVRARRALSPGEEG